MPHDLVVDKCLPYLIAEHGELVVGQSVDTLRELHDVGVFLDLRIELLYVDFLTVDLADALVTLSLCVGERAHELLGNEGKECKTYCCNENLASVADFL